MIIHGKNSIFERLKINPQSIKRIFLENNFKHPEIEKLIKSNRVPTERVCAHRLSKIKAAENLQGIVAKADNFLYTPFDELLKTSQDNQLTIIFLDRIYDPQNLGAIVRIAACFGGFAVVIPKSKACQINETAVHIASGGENYIAVSCITNLSTAIIAAKRKGFWIIGADINQDAETINKVAMPFPLGIVLGSEGEGIRYGISKHLDKRVRIPMNGAKLSFNVAVACAIICYEISKQR